MNKKKEKAIEISIEISPSGEGAVSVTNPLSYENGIIFFFFN